MGVQLIKISVIYFCIGVLLGLYMSLEHNYVYKGVHVHINLLGWTTLSLVGIIYVLFPKAEQTMLAKLHFWIHNIALPVMMIGLFLVLSGHSSFTPFIAIGGSFVVIGVIILSVNVIMNVKLSELVLRRN